MFLFLTISDREHFEQDDRNILPNISLQIWKIKENFYSFAAMLSMLSAALIK